MPSGERIYVGSVRALSGVFIALGVAMIVSTLVAGGGPASIGLIMGVAFVLVGGGRLWAASRMR